ncbi:YopN family type III secretion system gatekeeper subunit [Shewanella psychropiezotolerans]|uniref:YopN family type III secretion system gatekeeper subunit n=1 Tax=Shewanella psychropiezotolerans TaxID=2593655 RepID=A0ABX5X5Z7_9GAMM|nr:MULTISPECIES: type III secretion system gatekeeper subunit SctW [Shewanella]MPY25671.1 YopN family type III secretion system gatekeeper subunit [Shewanella sp. YLB-07]QDO86358.1 YopN family type III secretion system gatekeeper subunit [Shewanella psychropiezotolerans]
MPGINTGTIAADLTRNVLAQNSANGSLGTAISSGNYRGDIVKLVPDAKSLLDAAEELTFKASEYVEKDISKRKIQDDYGTVSEIHALVEEYLKKVPDLEKQQKLKDFVSNLSKQNVTVAHQLLAYLGSYSGDASEQFVALSEAKKQLTGKPEAKALLVLINASLANMAKEQGPQIRAGLNVYDAALALSSDKEIGDLQGLRDFYRDSVLDYSGLGDAFEKVLTRFGDKKITEAIGFLLKGLGADLQVQGSSIDKSKLQQIMNDIKKLKVINGLHEQVALLFERVKIAPAA